jgi:P27 family predicted phage terminase small subunit
MGRGRPRKPHRLRVLEGGRGHSRPLTPDLPAPSGQLVAPRCLGSAERAAWKEIVSHLREMGTESKADAGLVECGATVICRKRRADAVLAKKGLTMISHKGNVVKRPEHSISRECMLIWISVAAQLGLSPAARAKLGGDGSHREEAGEVPPELTHAKRR